jgi:hypothetical protein
MTLHRLSWRLVDVEALSSYAVMRSSSVYLRARSWPEVTLRRENSYLDICAGQKVTKP